MTKTRASAPYRDLLGTISEKLRKTTETLRKLGYDSKHVSPKEFYDFLTGETPTGDTITIADVLNSEYLMIHELVEISELKKIKVPINKRTAMDSHPKVYAAHFIATEHEMKYAFDQKDQSWIKLRQNHAKGWLDDKLLPRELMPKCKAAIKEMATLNSQLKNERRMRKDSHKQAVACIVSRCRRLPIISMLAYGSYARGDYRPNSDIDLLTVVDSKRYSSKDLKKLVDICHYCKKRFHIPRIDMDIILDSEIDLWNKGILLEGHSFIDVSFYDKEGQLLLGTDIRGRFRIPEDIVEKAQDLLGIIEAEFRRWLLETDDKERKFVPHWMTGWLLVTFLNTQKIVEVTSFEEACRQVERFPFLASMTQFKKYQQKKELTPDEFIKLHRIMRKFSEETRRIK